LLLAIVAVASGAADVEMEALLALPVPMITVIPTPKPPTIDGKLADGTMTGSWNHDASKGDFKLTKKN